MWAFLTYEEYLAMCGGQFLGGLLGIALVAAGIYYLIKAVLFLLPFFFVILMCYFIFNAGRVGVKKILLALRNALIFLLITLVVGAVFIGIAALLADNDHKILAVIFALPGIAIAFLGVLALLPIVFICSGSEEKDPDKLFPVLLLLAFFSEKIFSFFIWFIQDYIFLYIPSNIADMIPVTLTLLTILFIIQKRKCSVSKSLLIGFMPLVSVFVFYFFSIFRKNSVITLSLASYAITVLSYATSFVLPSLFL